MQLRLFTVLFGIFFLTAEVLAASITNQTRIALLDEEAAWIAGHSPVRVGVATKWPPFSYANTNGTQTGIDIDVLKLISRRTGVNFEIVAEESWQKTLNLLEQGQIDASAGTAWTPEREKMLRFTRPYYKSVVVIVTREGDFRFPHVARLQNAIMAVPKDYVTTDALRKRLPSARLIEAETPAECFKLVAQRKADATVANLFAITQYLNENPQRKLSISGEVSEFDFPLRLAVRREYPLLADVLDRALASISQEELDEIADHHLLFGLQGARRTALLHERIIYALLAAVVLSAVFVIWNYSMRKEMRARRKVETELQEINRSLEIFSHAISHDLKAPLRAIRGLSELLKDEYHDKLDSTGQDYLNRIIAAVARMDILVRDVLSYSQTSRGEFPLHAVSLNKLVHQLVGEFPPEQREYFHVRSELPEVQGNSTLLARCISNLLSNAVKYMPKERTPNIQIWSEQKDSLLKLWVEDNGIGIAPEDQERIFKVFQRVKSRDYQGTGIGLAVVAKGVERMGGSVGVESEPGKGSRFWIQLSIAERAKSAT